MERVSSIRSVKKLRQLYKRLYSEVERDVLVLPEPRTGGDISDMERARSSVQRVLEEIPKPNTDVVFGTNTPYERHVIDVYYQKVFGLLKDTPHDIAVRLLNLGFRPGPVERRLKRKLPGQYTEGDILGSYDDQVRRETNLAYANMALQAEYNARNRQLGKMMSSMTNIVRIMENTEGQVMERRIWNAFDIPSDISVFGHQGEMSTLESRAANVIKMAWKRSVMFKRYVFWGTNGCGDIYNADLRILWLRKVVMGFKFLSAPDGMPSIFPKKQFWIDLVRNFPLIEWELANFNICQEDGSVASALSLNGVSMGKLADALHVFDKDVNFDWISFVTDPINMPPSFEYNWYKDTINNIYAHLSEHDDV